MYISYGGISTVNRGTQLELGAMARTIVFILIGTLAVYLAYVNFDNFDPGKNIVKLSVDLKAS